MCYHRTLQHVARGIDHFQVVMYLAGGAEFVVQDRTLVQRAGDVSLIDMSQPNLTREIQPDDGYVQVISIMMPRLLLSPLLTIPANNVAIKIVSRDTAQGRMLADFILALRRSAAELTHSESQAAIQSLALLVAAGAEQSDEPATPLSQETLRTRVRLHVETNLGVASLGLESLCRQFNLSRAGLYRLFAPQSPMSYIQQRRLQRAFAMLLSPAFRAWRIIDIALEYHFSSDATFIRAFRREFGLSPGEARKLARQRVPGAPAGTGAALPQPDEEALRWITELTGTVLSVPGR